MQILSRVIFAAGALLASAPSSWHDPGGLTGPSIQVCNSIPTDLRMVPSPSSMFNIGPSLSVALITRPKSRVVCNRSTTNNPSTFHHQISSPTTSLYHNQTLIGPHPVTIGPANYDGPNELALVDERRELIVYRRDGPRDLAVYNRPNSLVLHTPPINFIRFWVDPRYYQLVTYVYRPRFAHSTSMFSQYTHLEPRDFGRWVAEAMVANDRSVLRKVFNLTPLEHLTIGVVGKRLEAAALVLVYTYALGLLVSFMMVAHDECLELVKVTALDQHTVFIEACDTDFAASLPIRRHIGLEEITGEVVGEDKWWEAGTEQHSDVQPDLAVAYIDTSPPCSIPSDIPTPSSDPVLPPAPAKVPEASRCRRLSTKPTQCPGGPRFKSAAWKRCRVK